MPNASMIKYRLNSSQWPIRKRLETMLEPLKRNEQPSPLKRNEQPSRLKRNELQMPRRLLLKRPRYSTELKMPPHRPKLPPR